MIAVAVFVLTALSNIQVIDDGTVSDVNTDYSNHSSFDMLSDEFEVRNTTFDSINDIYVDELAGKLLYRAEENGSEFYVWGGEEYRRFEAVSHPDVLDGELVYVAWEGLPINNPGSVVINRTINEEYKEISGLKVVDNSLAVVVQPEDGVYQVKYRNETGPRLDTRPELSSHRGKLLYDGILQKGGGFLRYGKQTVEKPGITDRITVGKDIIYQYRDSEFNNYWKVFGGERINISEYAQIYDVGGEIGYTRMTEADEVGSHVFVYGNTTLGADTEYIIDIRIEEGVPILKTANGTIGSRRVQVPEGLSFDAPYWEEKNAFIETPGNRYGPFEDIRNIGTVNGTIVYRAKTDQGWFFFKGDKRKREVPENVMSQVYGESTLAYEAKEGEKRRMIVNETERPAVQDVYKGKNIGGKAVFVESTDEGLQRIIYGNKPVVEAKEIIEYVETEKGLTAIFKGDKSYYILREN